MAQEKDATDAAVESPNSMGRWLQLLLGLAVMMAVSSPQYVWTLFTSPLVS